MAFPFPMPPDQPEEEAAFPASSAEEVVPEIEETSAAAEPAPEAPAEEQWEPNGGPLGCCLGVVVGLLLSLTIAVLSRFYGDALWNMFGSNLGLLTRILMGVIGIGAAVLCGFIGWRVGRRFYREYEPSPRQQRKLAELERRDRKRADRYRQKAKYVR